MLSVIILLGALTVKNILPQEVHDNPNQIFSQHGSHSDVPTLSPHLWWYQPVCDHNEEVLLQMVAHHKMYTCEAEQTLALNIHIHVAPDKIIQQCSTIW